MEKRSIALIVSLLVIGVIFTSGCTSAKTNTCDDLAKNFDAKINSIGVAVCDVYNKLPAEGGQKPIWVGGTLIDISKTYNSAADRNEFHLTFQGATKQGTISIGTKSDSIPYSINQFYKFDLGHICELIYSMQSSGMFSDPDLNALEPLTC